MLRDRIAKLERQAASSGAEFTLIDIIGGLPSPPHPLFAIVGPLVLKQGPGEAKADFRERTIAAAQAAGERWPVISSMIPHNYVDDEAA